MSWDDAMRVISAETQQLIDQVFDPDCHYIGPYECNGENVDAIVDLLWDHGLVLDDDGYAAPVADEDDDDDESIHGADDEDEPDELVAWCPGCRCERTFAILPDSEIEGDIDPDWVYWCCVMWPVHPGATLPGATVGGGQHDHLPLGRREQQHLRRGGSLRMGRGEVLQRLSA